jgi:hypothetical protein
MDYMHNRQDHRFRSRVPTIETSRMFLQTQKHLADHEQGVTIN